MVKAQYQYYNQYPQQPYHQYGQAQQNNYYPYYHQQYYQHYARDQPVYQHAVPTSHSGPSYSVGTPGATLHLLCHSCFRRRRSANSIAKFSDLRYRLRAY
uniref:Uncharacterized protein n=1 Tax=Plectus sambesii TaxID=2011161 RepID=A0A914XKM0_9BILA